MTTNEKLWRYRSALRKWRVNGERTKPKLMFKPKPEDFHLTSALEAQFAQKVHDQLMKEYSVHQ